MKKIQIAVIALMIGITTDGIQAQSLFPVIKKYSAAEKVRLEQNFLYALTSENNGLVSSALSIVTMMKLNNPKDEFKMISKQIDYLAAHSEIPEIRYRACLAGAVFADPEEYQEVVKHVYASADELFSALDNNQATTLLSTK